MIKELEALEEIKTLRGFNQVELNNDKNINKSLDVIEQALNELQTIKNAKPSEVLEKIENNLEHHYPENIRDFNILKQALLKAQEQEKVLNIIIKKNVSVWGFRNRVFGYQKEQKSNRIINDTYEYYLSNFGCYHNGFDIELLTQEEFDTLKEYFK